MIMGVFYISNEMLSVENLSANHNLFEEIIESREKARGRIISDLLWEVIGPNS